jgi:hypothetical protein
MPFKRTANEDGQDTEGHMAFKRKANEDGQDTEGHRFRKAGQVEEGQDAEGHVRRIKAQDDVAQEGEDEDTEGHLFLPNDPGTARSLSQGRSSEIEREVRERQRQKEARPNRR